MTTEAEHETVRELLPAAALDLVEDGELARVVAHVRGCLECADMLDDYCVVTADLGLVLAVPPVDPARSQRLLARLLARARLEAQARGETRLRHPSDARRLHPSAGWAVAAALAGVLLMHHGVHRPVDFGWVTAGVLALVALGFALFSMRGARQPVEGSAGEHPASRGREPPTPTG
ncbi:MAG: hypothetical protein H0W36_15825 [Gemmatimonadetes bacterium]|nr:hypothetical protein [Gemmatimonadota bacterium]